MNYSFMSAYTTWNGLPQKELGMTIESDKDLAGLRNAGRVVGLAIEAMRANLQPGMITADHTQPLRTTVDRSAHGGLGRHPGADHHLGDRPNNHSG
jgi:hypothetical protein